MAARRAGVALPLVALGLLVLAGLAFWPPYLSRWRSAPGLWHAHAALGVAWLALLVAQPLWLRAGQRATHRLAGRLGGAVGVLFLVSGLLVSQRSLARMGAEQFAREGRFVYLPLAMVLLFALALALGLWWRRSPAVHARFMASTLLPLLDPVFARLLYFYAPPLPAESLYPVPALLTFGLALAGMAGTLPAQAPGRRAYQAYALVAAAVLGGFFVVPHLAPWGAFVQWLRDWPIA